MTPGAMRFNGTTWSDFAGTPDYLSGLSGSGPNDVWGFGENAEGTGTAWHFNGTAWSETELPEFMAGSWSNGPNDVWAVGLQGKAMHYDGTWHLFSTPATGNLGAVWGASASDVWAVGQKASLLHWSGTSWTAATPGLPSGIDVELSAIWGSGAKDVWIGGHQGPGTYSMDKLDITNPSPTLFHFDGMTWTTVTVPIAKLSVSSIWGTGPKDVWVGGHSGPSRTPKTVMMHYDGTAWTDFAPPAGVTKHFIMSIWGSGTTDIWAVGYDYTSPTGGVILHYN